MYIHIHIYICIYIYIYIYIHVFVRSGLFTCLIRMYIHTHNSYCTSQCAVQVIRTIILENCVLLKSQPLRHFIRRWGKGVCS